MNKLQEILARIGMFVQRYTRAIMIGLLLCVMAQQCTIVSLRQELAFVKQKYEQPIQHIVERYSDETVNDAASDQGYTFNHEEISDEQSDALVSAHQGTQGGGIPSWLSWLVTLIIVGAGYWFVARQYGFYPYGVRVKGRIWQDLQGRVVFTLEIRNRTRTNVVMSDAMIEFMGVRETRKFKVPVADFPLTMSEGTRHTVNISMQKVLERDQSLLNYKAIRATVSANGRSVKTMPLGVKFKH